MCFGPFRVLRPLCHWGPIITISLVTFITVSAIISYLEVFPPTLDHPGRIIHFIFMLMWPIVIFNNYFQAVFLGPGFVPLGWVPEDKTAITKLQYCIHCEGYKAPRSHHCRQCKRCVMKMDHHCPWINTCCGHRNHTRFIYFLITAPLGCFHGAIILGITIYVKMYQILYVASNPRTRHKFQFSSSPFVEFNVYHLICCFIGIGASLGVMIAVGFLLYVQISVARKNETGIESWIKAKAEAREREDEFIYPYNLGWKENLKQVITWQGRPKGDGFTWPVVEGCDQYTLTVEQLTQKERKKHRTIEYIAVEDYSGSWFPITKGLCTCCRVPISEEPRIPISEGDTIMVTRWKKYWLYGDKCLTDEDKEDGLVRVRGWFPRRCVEKVMVEYSESDHNHTSDKDENTKKTD
ncbi:Palmitoyltransferase ZDHHC6 [Holothuria leucospilota]|uniref:Palmitoyltransferase n=1 Tax=Holothuria leucospilota TaxID=206669 RepID=A0A9Q0YKE9_HOLLE|nr:Palmitoyltransferase ZDHHC6 [Holothuria leucospilota]